MTGRHTVDSITSDALDQLYAEIDRLTAELGDYDQRVEEQQAAIARVRAVPDHPLAQPAPPDHEQVGYVKGWMAASAAYLAALGEQPAPAPAATQAGEPREHCGRLMPAWSLGPRTECVLPPGHQGSHADDCGARWWYDPTGDSGAPCTCGGRFSLQHLHADQHQPKEQR